jgi:hypothetical protein
MADYGFFDQDGQKVDLSMIDDKPAAQGLLKLLDLTIGRNDGDVVPYDLGDALDRIASKAPLLRDTTEFRRLSTAARR